MTMNQLRYFVTLAHTEHYGRAAEELFVSQPSLSRAIALLEEELDVELFSHVGRNIALTRAGRMFLIYAERALAQVELGCNAMRRFSNHTEVLSVGCITPFLGKNDLHAYLVENIHRADGVQLDVRVSQTEQLLEDLRKRKYDVVFCSYAPEATELVFLPVVELPFVVALREDDPLAAQAEIAPEQLAGCSMVLNTEPVYSALLQQLFDAYHLSPMVCGSSNEDAVLMRMVADGVGLLISTEHMQMHMAGTTLRPLKQELFHRYVYLAYQPGAVRSRAAERLIQYARGRVLHEEGLQPKAADRLTLGASIDFLP